jgi:serine/threonine protein kinase
VYEFFYENNTAYFTMEYLSGCDLKGHLKKNSTNMSEAEVTYIMSKVSDALMIVHSTGVLHRDIKPDNIYICDDGTVKLIDFGAARQILGEESKSLSVILTPGYAPLEQYQRRGKQGQWTDIYALGATIYYAVTGVVIDDAMSRLDDESLDKATSAAKLINLCSKCNTSFHKIS